MKAEALRLMEGSTPISSGEESVLPPEKAPSRTAEATSSSAAQTDLWIFRDGRKLVAGPEMVSDLERRISESTANSNSIVDAFIQAGALEAALADANSSRATLAAKLTDVLAMSLCDGNVRTRQALKIASQVQAPEQLSICPPEGFTYYALHPLDFRAVTSRISDQPERCALIGIRSIGTSLSAMCASALRSAGRAVSRITVRPTGHPYARETRFTADEILWINQQLTASAQFLIVDEGPGRSGSTFLSVAEALIRAGVPNEKITMLGSRQPDPHSLCAADAAARWRSFRFLATIPSVNRRFERCNYIGGGNWREFVFTDANQWPECWTQMERLKFISHGQKTLFKFEGMGPLGADVRNRAFVLADAGFSPRVSDVGDGFLEYEFIRGRPLRVQDLSSSLLERMAHYCAFRLSNFGSRQADSSELQRMLEYNLLQECGVEVSLPADLFATGTPVLSDGRMQPYEWVVSKEKVIKVDGISHGDDHFFPGPCDIGWDLAGIAIEWKLDAQARDYLVTQFRRFTGRDVRTQLAAYMLAYSVFRMGFCKMGISTVRGSSEESRLKSSYEHYRAFVKPLLGEVSSEKPLLPRVA
jgi:hypothetical protein